MIINRRYENGKKKNFIDFINIFTLSYLQNGLWFPTF